MVFRKAYDTVNKVGGAWMNLNQGFYNSPSKSDRTLEQARILLEEVVVDWPAGMPEPQSVRAAREYLRQLCR